MSSELSKELSKVVHRMGMEREDRIISGKTKLTVQTILRGFWEVKCHLRGHRANFLASWNYPQREVTAPKFGNPNKKDTQPAQPISIRL